MHFSRTLSYYGEKTMISTVRSKNAATHSYTVQPIILCFKVPEDGISDNMKNNFFENNNVVVTCNVSGKLLNSSVLRQLARSNRWKRYLRENKGFKRNGNSYRDNDQSSIASYFLNYQYKVLGCRVYDRVIPSKIIQGNFRQSQTFTSSLINHIVTFRLATHFRTCAAATTA